MGGPCVSLGGKTPLKEGGKPFPNQQEVKQINKNYLHMTYELYYIIRRHSVWHSKDYNPALIQCWDCSVYIELF